MKLPSSTSLLAKLKASQLKYCAFLLGLPSTGTKSELETVLQRRLHHYDDAAPESGPQRIVSVDMGIRNLAYCVLEVSRRQPTATSPDALKVEAWRRVDVLAAQDVHGNAAVSEYLPTSARHQARRITSAVLPHLQSAFTPRSLSKTAYEISTALLNHQPTTILIERQRFRSAGGAAIQEWTVRVNMLESMLWACMETMRHDRFQRSDSFPAVYEVSPARVANFWTAKSEVPLRPPHDLFSEEKDTQVGKLTRRKVEKKDKIAIAKSWLEGNDKDMALAFSGDAADVAAAFREKLPSKKTARKDRTASGAESITKLDDLADCLLQAVAWVRWQQNAHKMHILHAQSAR